MITPELAGFLEDGLSIYVGARNEALEPVGARGAAVQVEPGGQHLVVFVADCAAARIVPSLQSNGLAAVSVARPVDDRACQVKGTAVGIAPADHEDHPFVCAQWDRFMRQLETVGIPRQVASGWSMWPAVAIRIAVTDVFEQTPGPHAGNAIP